MFMIFSLNRLDVLPVDDLGLRVAVQNIYGMKTRPDAKRLRAIGKKWSPFETVGTWYAWRSLDATIVNY
jgi:DNA-3-methyladenine glycosylase II